MPFIVFYLYSSGTLGSFESESTTYNFYLKIIIGPVENSKRNSNILNLQVIPAHSELSHDSFFDDDPDFFSIV